MCSIFYIFVLAVSTFLFPWSVFCIVPLSDLWVNVSTWWIWLTCNCILTAWLYKNICMRHTLQYVSMKSSVNGKLWNNSSVLVKVYNQPHTEQWKLSDTWSCCFDWVRGAVATALGSVRPLTLSLRLWASTQTLLFTCWGIPPADLFSDGNYRKYSSSASMEKAFHSWLPSASSASA